MSIYDYFATLENGKTYSLKELANHPVLIVNTATKCGYAPQFDGLEKLYKKYKDQGLMILGFPSNQFKQELDDASEAAKACQLTYGVTFPMHQIIAVNGKDTDPLFKYLKENSKGVLGSSTIKWNFTKFLVNKEGNVVARYAPQTEPKDLEEDIKEVL
ncbi:glutathione peroxidase [Leuconostoc litchii]|uniref:Glutathione peroxidase n=1 Tax=Leuconostoc litchii TaxID=1981069 RepID=A0A652NDR5_9LACO|nr:glutathione peroxidase [Leuconostoc litchii]TYC46149.1 glutathione peroxidase [Leuconostoc litchii]GMA69906.1 glutathione peroxidase [Leuconostoc litchii]